MMLLPKVQVGLSAELLPFALAEPVRERARLSMCSKKVQQVYTLTRKSPNKIMKKNGGKAQARTSRMMTRVQFD